MSSNVPTRKETFELLKKYNKSESLIKHALAVEAAMRAYARKLGQDEEKWAVTGLIHDFDYEQHPTAEEHPAWGAKLLEEQGWPEDIVYAVKCHGDHLALPRRSLMDKTLYAVDELTGLIVAVALVRPSKSIMDVKLKSIKKNLTIN